MSINYRHKLKRLCIKHTCADRIFTEYQKCLNAIHSLCTCSDTHINKSLWVVLGLNLKYTVSRASDMSRNNSYISYKCSCFCCYKVLCKYYHWMFCWYICLCYSFDFICNLDVFEALCKVLIACRLYCAAAFYYSLCNLFKRIKVIVCIYSLCKIHMLFISRRINQIYFFACLCGLF